MISLTDLEAAARLVYATMPPTPQIHWPLLSARAGCEVWVKHENHTPIGAFKVRGSLVYLHELRAQQPAVPGVITATRGNHGQGIALAASRLGLRAVVVVPHGNSPEKNAAMRGFGAEVREFGQDFDEAKAHAEEVAATEGLTFVPSFAPALVAGVGTYALELLRAVPDLHTVYVPIGLGSGICGVVSARDALGLATRIVGVVHENYPAYAQSVAAGRVVATAPPTGPLTIADGLAVRVPSAAALAIIRAGVERIVTVREAEVAAAVRHYCSDTHNMAEGAGAAPLAALLQAPERAALRGQKVALILCGSNIDRDVYQRVLAG